MKFNFKKGEAIFMLFLIGLGVLLFYESLITVTTVEEPVTASAYGMVISGIFLIAVISRLIILIAAVRKENNTDKLEIKHPALIFLSILGILIYTLGIIKIGYYVTTFVFSSVMVMALREKENRTLKTGIFTVIGCLLFTLALYFVFTQFKVYLPNAWLI